MRRYPRDAATIAARLTWGSLAGRSLDDADRARLASGLGGVVLFERNLGTPEEVRELTDEIRLAAAGPVRISVDQEGGHIARFGPPFTAFGGPLAIAATGSEHLAFEVAAASARELRALGIDTVLAPVVDVAGDPANPTIAARAFGSDPARVARLGAAMVRGYLAGGVVPVPKHFPGHGRTAEDSHVGAARVPGSRTDLDTTDLPPFAAVVEAAAPALMVGHMIVDALEHARPASLSTATARLARRELRFDGLLVTDALVMDAIADDHPLGDAAAQSLRAGIDVVMALEGQRRVLAGLAEAIAAEEVPVARVRRALDAVARLDGLAAALPGAPLAEPLPAASARVHRTLASRVARRSLTLVEDPDGLVPIDAGAGLLVVDVRATTGSPIEGHWARASAAGETYEAGFPRAAVRPVAADDPAALAAVIGEAAHAEIVLLLTRDLFVTAATDLPERLAAGGTPVVHAALRNPLDLALPGPAARVAAYADTPATHRALAEALRLGRTAFAGTLPLPIATLAAARGDEAA